MFLIFITSMIYQFIFNKGLKLDKTVKHSAFINISFIKKWLLYRGDFLLIELCRVSAIIPCLSKIIRVLDVVLFTSFIISRTSPALSSPIDGIFAILVSTLWSLVTTTLTANQWGFLVTYIYIFAFFYSSPNQLNDIRQGGIEPPTIRLHHYSQMLYQMSYWRQNYIREH